MSIFTSFRVNGAAVGFFADGSASAPSMTFASNSSMGWFKSITHGMSFAEGGNEFIRLTNAGDIEFTLFGGGAGPNLVPDAANVLAVKAGSTGQTLRVYGHAANAAYLSLNHDGTNGNISASSGGVCIGTGSTTPVLLCQRYRVDFTVPALSSNQTVESTVTVTGLTTNSVLILQPRQKLNSSVTGVFVMPRCSTANELTLAFSNVSNSSLSGSTQSGYLLQFGF